MNEVRELAKPTKLLDRDNGANNSSTPHEHQPTPSDSGRVSSRIQELSLIFLSQPSPINSRHQASQTPSIHTLQSKRRGRVVAENQSQVLKNNVEHSDDTSEEVRSQSNSEDIILEYSSPSGGIPPSQSEGIHSKSSIIPSEEENFAALTTPPSNSSRQQRQLAKSSSSSPPKITPENQSHIPNMMRTISFPIYSPMTTKPVEEATYPMMPLSFDVWIEILRRLPCWQHALFRIGPSSHTSSTQFSNTEQAAFLHYLDSEMISRIRSVCSQFCDIVDRHLLRSPQALHASKMPEYHWNRLFLSKIGFYWRNLRVIHLSHWEALPHECNPLWKHLATAAPRLEELYACHLPLGVDESFILDVIQPLANLRSLWLTETPILSASRPQMLVECLPQSLRFLELSYWGNQKPLVPRLRLAYALRRFREDILLSCVSGGQNWPGYCYVLNAAHTFTLDPKLLDQSSVHLPLVAVLNACRRSHQRQLFLFLLREIPHSMRNHWWPLLGDAVMLGKRVSAARSLAWWKCLVHEIRLFTPVQLLWALLENTHARLLEVSHVEGLIAMLTEAWPLSPSQLREFRSPKYNLPLFTLLVRAGFPLPRLQSLAMQLSLATAEAGPHPKEGQMSPDILRWPREWAVAEWLLRVGAPVNVLLRPDGGEIFQPEDLQDLDIEPISHLEDQLLLTEDRRWVDLRRDTPSTLLRDWLLWRPPSWVLSLLASGATIQAEELHLAWIHRRHHLESAGRRVLLAAAPEEESSVQRVLAAFMECAEPREIRKSAILPEVVTFDCVSLVGALERVPVQQMILEMGALQALMNNYVSHFARHLALDPTAAYRVLEIFWRLAEKTKIDLSSSPLLLQAILSFPSGGHYWTRKCLPRLVQEFILLGANIHASNPDIAEGKSVVQWAHAIGDSRLKSVLGVNVLS